MKPCCVAIVLAVLAAACDSAVAPTAPDPRPVLELPAGLFTLSGHIKASDDGTRLAGARLTLIAEGPPLTSVTDENGEYRFDNVRGRVQLVAGMDGYGTGNAVLWVAKDETVNLLLDRMLFLVPGTTLRGTVSGAPDMSYDAAAPAQRIAFIPPASGRYELVLTVGNGSEVDLLVDGDQSLYWTGDGSTPIRALVPADAGIKRDIIIHSYYAPVTFELTATLVSP